MGRNPKPTALQLAQGDPRKIGRHKLEEKLKAEPKATRGLPECPKHLTGLARIAWRLWKQELEVMNLDRAPDAAMLEGCCQNYAQAVLADAMLEKQGIVIEEFAIDDNGEKVLLRVKMHPAVSVSRKAWGLVRSFCSEFGLSPASRTRLAIEKPDTGEADLMEILSRPRKPGIPRVQ